MMDIEIDISYSILDQFSRQLGVEVVDKKLIFPADLGTGQITLVPFPGRIEFYHFKFNLLTPVELQSTNPKGSEWLLLNINLSKSVVEKVVNRQEVNIQKFLPSGILFYTPNTHVFSRSPRNTDFEIVLIRIHQDFFQQYQSDKITKLQHTESAILYEDLGYTMESALNSVFECRDNKIRAAAFLMQFLADFVDKLRGREVLHNYEHLHPMDVKGLFMAAAHLRDPIKKSIPSVKELAEIAGMGTTKFKTTFKQVFGKAPIQYHQSVKFDYARRELEAKRKTATELSYILGYSHPSKFTSAFKKIFGELPSAFR